MGIAVYLALENEVPGFNVSDVDGKSLARAWPNQKDEVLAPLEEFISVSEDQRAQFLAETPEISPDTIPPPQWFDAAAGLVEVRKILQTLRETPQVLDVYKSQHADFAERVIQDVLGIERGLELAVEQGTRFHLALDY